MAIIGYRVIIRLPVFEYSTLMQDDMFSYIKVVTFLRNVFRSKQARKFTQRYVFFYNNLKCTILIPSPLPYSKPCKSTVQVVLVMIHLVLSFRHKLTYRFCHICPLYSQVDIDSGARTPGGHNTSLRSGTHSPHIPGTLCEMRRTKQLIYQVVAINMEY